MSLSWSTSWHREGVERRVLNKTVRSRWRLEVMEGSAIALGFGAVRWRMEGGVEEARCKQRFAICWILESRR
jgi:hypothetical protein